MEEDLGESFFADDLGIVTTESSAEDAFFDSVIGHIEDILMEEGFQDLQKSFMEKYWHEFDDDDENKLCYMDIFNEYINIIERHIETHLTNKIPNFSMAKFIEHLQMRRNELDGEVFEMLFTFSDFIAFKEMFLDYRAVKTGTIQDLSVGICVTSGTIAGTSQEFS
ncbi:hypothetical protein L9F63_020723 [Diploptera punctata]|uniref:ADP-ribosylation factor-like protein 2-binding protein n=1 Tax=Diploptera punctata TaxID=6984 RepID=A0AAD7ZQW7_DIPPU|nr:hypothetical protein L9F63_020723 [Diploptera punctata]